MASAGRGEQMVGEVRSRMAVEARVTPGKPYSAEAVTESTQVLADGNRIVRKSTTRMYRDSEGRTRREQINDERRGREHLDRRSGRSHQLRAAAGDPNRLSRRVRP